MYPSTIYFCGRFCMSYTFSTLRCRASCMRVEFSSNNRFLSSFCLCNSAIWSISCFLSATSASTCAEFSFFHSLSLFSSSKRLHMFSFSLHPTLDIFLDVDICCTDISSFPVPSLVVFSFHFQCIYSVGNSTLDGSCSPSYLFVGFLDGQSTVLLSFGFV